MMGTIFGIIVGLIILVALVVAHEFGHALAARRSGVRVEEFGIGFPPQAYKTKLKNGTIFSLNWLPLGGFVKLQGEYDASDKKGDYGAASFLQKTKILLAGVAVNFLVAAVLFSALSLFGLPKIIDGQFNIPSDATVVNQPVEVIGLKSGFPADKAGIKVGDKIIKLAGVRPETPSRLIQLTKENHGKTVAVVYERDDKENTVEVKLGDDKSGVLLGANLGQREYIRATWSAPIVGFGTATQYSVLTMQSIGQLLYNLGNGLVSQLNPDPVARQHASDGLKSVGDSVSGPVGILGTIFPAAEAAGLTQLVFLTAIISVSLAVMNILPIPALDGGRWFTMVVFRLFKKKLTREREEKIQSVGFTILMGLVVVVTVLDIFRLF
ncbi:PDZ domain-containing protein [Candidatus Saccharibacteria bacterium]|nr:PDZ domain-containing protein [Candidatus Saccharibacteria bacterium]